jgi:hypothetical protein
MAQSGHPAAARPCPLLGVKRTFAKPIIPGLYERHGTRLCAHALNPTMHRASAANTATFNTASIMLPSTESRIAAWVLICRRAKIFPGSLWVGDDRRLRNDYAQVPPLNML